MSKLAGRTNEHVVATWETVECFSHFEAFFDILKPDKFRYQNTGFLSSTSGKLA